MVQDHPASLEENPVSKNLFVFCLVGVFWSLFHEVCGVGFFFFLSLAICI